MKRSLFGLVNWVCCDPRRTVAIVLVVFTVLMLATAIVPGGAALAGEITSGS